MAKPTPIEVLRRRVVELHVALAASEFKDLKPGTLQAIQRDAFDLFDADDEGEVVPRQGVSFAFEGLERHLRKSSPFYFSDGAPSKTSNGDKIIAWNDSKAIGEHLEEIACGTVVIR